MEALRSRPWSVVRVSLLLVAMACACSAQTPQSQATQSQSSDVLRSDAARLLLDALLARAERPKDDSVQKSMQDLAGACTGQTSPDLACARQSGSLESVLRNALGLPPLPADPGTAIGTAAPQGKGLSKEAQVALAHRLIDEAARSNDESLKRLAADFLGAGVGSLSRGASGGIFPGTSATPVRGTAGTFGRIDAPSFTGSFTDASGVLLVMVQNDGLVTGSLRGPDGEETQLSGMAAGSSAQGSATDAVGTGRFFATTSADAVDLTLSASEGSALARGDARFHFQRAGMRSTADSSTASIDQGLVGTWVHQELAAGFGGGGLVERVIVLNQDGTYTQGMPGAEAGGRWRAADGVMSVMDGRGAFSRLGTYALTDDGSTFRLTSDAGAQELWTRR